MICAIGLGLVLSSGIGEQPTSFSGFARCGGQVRLSVSGDTSNKLESGSGWIAGADLDYRPLSGTISPLIGLGYRHRDGGRWVKKSAWARAGIAYESARLVFAQDLNSENHVSVLSLEAPVSLSKHFGFEVGAGAVRFQQAGSPTIGALLSLSFRYTN